jgi:hypothetical protein
MKMALASSDIKTQRRERDRRKPRGQKVLVSGGMYVRIEPVKAVIASLRAKAGRTCFPEIILAGAPSPLM